MDREHFMVEIYASTLKFDKKKKYWIKSLQKKNESKACKKSKDCK